MTKRAAFVIMLLLIARTFGTTPLRAITPRWTGPRTSCARMTSQRIQVKALATPIAGQELVLELSAVNRAESGLVEVLLRAPDGALEPLEGPLAWSRNLTQGQVQTWTTRVRVINAAPIPLTAKARSALAPATLSYAEHHVTLYPFEVKEGTLRPTWNEETLQPLSATPLPEITLPGGQKAVVTGARGRIVR